MKENNWHYEKAFEFIKSKKPTINPNYGFKDQLKLYEEELFNPLELNYNY